MKRTCRHCHEDLSHVPPTVAMTRHLTGLCAPSRNEVEAAIQQLEIDDEREREAIRAFWKREKEMQQVTGKGMLKLFGAILLGSAFVAYLLFAGPILEWVRSVLQ